MLGDGVAAGCVGKVTNKVATRPPVSPAELGLVPCPLVVAANLWVAPAIVKP